MATRTKLESMPVSRFAGPPRKHDWDSLLDGSIWRIVPGEDFTSTLSSYRAQASTAARVRGKYASIHRDPENEGAYLLRGYPRNGAS